VRCQLSIATKRGVILNGVLFREQEERKADTVMIAITGIHGNFYSNPFYNNIGDTLSSNNIDFIYAQTNDAFGQIRTCNILTKKEEIIGSWNERFSFTDDDIDAYLSFAKKEGYEYIVLAGHSLGANKVIYYLSETHDERVDKFFVLSPANLDHMMSGVTPGEAEMIKAQVERGDGDKMLPFPFMGWVECIAFTAYDWYFGGLLNNVHTSPDGDFSQAEKMNHTGALLVGTYDNFTDGDPSEFLKNLNDHMPTKDENQLLFIEKTGHTYQMKNQEVAELILRQIQKWRSEKA
jgi:pimeloyl-ACP methyl ester carboxylesterase